MPRFIGIDLAWSRKHPTGLAALDYDPRTKTGSLMKIPAEAMYSDDQVIAFVEQAAGKDQTLIVAIDAPLAVPNVTGRRPAEARLNRAFQQFHAGAHPANRKRLAGYNQGQVRGEVIVRRLENLGIRHTPVIVPGQPTRQVFEVYPHPAMVVLFKLDRILKYKRHREGRRDEFKKYQDCLRGLRNALPAFDVPDAFDLFSDKHLDRRGAKLKAYEDQLDAIFCAYIGLYYWFWGKQRCHIFGDRNDYMKGYIVSPVDRRIKFLGERTK